MRFANADQTRTEIDTTYVDKVFTLIKPLVTVNIVIKEQLNVET